MTDALNPLSRQAPSDALARKALEKSTKSAALAPTSLGVAGAPIRSYDIRRAVVVKQGQSVMLTVGQGSGFSITARVEAMQDGKIGDQIRLKNPDSGRLLTGIVTGPNAARGL